MNWKTVSGFIGNLGFMGFIVGWFGHVTSSVGEKGLVLSSDPYESIDEEPMRSHLRNICANDGMTCIVQCKILYPQKA